MKGVSLPPDPGPNSPSREAEETRLLTFTPRPEPFRGRQERSGPEKRSALNQTTTDGMNARHVPVPGRHLRTPPPLTLTRRLQARVICHVWGTDEGRDEVGLRHSETRSHSGIRVWISDRGLPSSVGRTHSSTQPQRAPKKGEHPPQQGAHPQTRPLGRHLQRRRPGHLSQPVTHNALFRLPPQ